MTDCVNVLVVDDSALVRKLLTEVLNAHPRIRVMDTAVDAQEARQKIKQLDPDVVTLDIEMPGMNGLDFLEKIMTLRPTPVVMVSTLTQKGAQASLRALQLGAFDYVAKPQGDLARSLGAYGDELHNKVIGAANANLTQLATQVRCREQKPTELVFSSQPIRGESALAPIVAIGASTGGTEAINSLLSQFPANTPGVVISQHLPESFSESFAARLDQHSSMTVRLAKDGERILTGHVYVAPGDHHLEVYQDGAYFHCRVLHTEPVNRHRPSVDVMFHSLANCARNRTTAVLLTGMGKDGAKGLKALKEAGARTIVQDEASSVVWGMPGAAFQLEAHEHCLPLMDIAEKTLALCNVA